MMSDQPTSDTHLSLIDRLRNPADQDAWGEFDRRYSPRIRSWCLRWGLQPVDADDLCQQLLLKLLDKLRTFVYDPSRSFRSWLKTVARHAVSDFVRQRVEKVEGSGDNLIGRLLAGMEAPRDLAQQLEEQFDLDLLEVARSRARQRVKPATWKLFVESAVDGLPAAEVAQMNRVTVDQVYVIKRRVMKMLREEVQRLGD
jgi:RNA polymerase sigma-70 factor (ECF subfamily)